MMKFLFVFVIIMISINLSYAQEGQLYTYNDDGMPDPFTPLVTKEGKLIISSGAIRSVSDIVLEGIMYDPSGESVAVINGLILKENDQVGKLKVKKIEKDAITIIYGQQEHKFKLKE